MDVVERYRRRRAARLKMRMDADDDGIWRTTENGHKIHINSEGDIDKGNPRVLEKTGNKKLSREQIEAKKSDNERISERVSKERYKAGEYKRLSEEYAKTKDPEKRQKIVEDAAVQMMAGMDKSDAVGDFLYDYDYAYKYYKQYDEEEMDLPSRAEIVEQTVDRIIHDGEEDEGMDSGSKSAREMREAIKKFILERAESFCTIDDERIENQAREIIEKRLQEQELRDRAYWASIDD